LWNIIRLWNTFSFVMRPNLCEITRCYNTHVRSPTIQQKIPHEHMVQSSRLQFLFEGICAKEIIKLVSEVHAPAYPIHLTSHPSISTCGIYKGHGLSAEIIDTRWTVKAHYGQCCSCTEVIKSIPNAGHFQNQAA
jgi:hypothetical protein